VYTEQVEGDLGCDNDNSSACRVFPFRDTSAKLRERLPRRILKKQDSHEDLEEEAEQAEQEQEQEQD
jgi:hypothetical protein